jgi:hypothetical protein
VKRETSRALTQKEARGLLEPLSNPMLVDELAGRVLVHAPIVEALQIRWMDGRDELPRRAAWKILAGRIAAKRVKDLDVGATLARIERELPVAPYRVKGGDELLCCLDRHPPPRLPGRGHRRRRAPRPVGPATRPKRLHVELRAGEDPSMARALQRREDRRPEGHRGNRKVEEVPSRTDAGPTDAKVSVD